MATPLKPRSLKLQRPMPPAGIGKFNEGDQWPLDFVPAPELRDWAFRTFVAETGPLYNLAHRHLDGADIEFMWAAHSFERAGRTVVGTAEQVTFRAGGWQKQRQSYQMHQWFGRLVEHELHHVAHATDKWGNPAFYRDTGKPKLAIRGHDVEEFVDVVRRYGTGPSIQPLAALVAAAQAGPEIADAAIAGACGVCIAAAA